MARAIGAAMRRMLVVNDMHGNRVMREAILSDMNSLNRFVDQLLDGYQWQPTNTQELEPTSKRNGGNSATAIISET